MKQMKKDDAVSPVVGVMLMLVVTIIIAAVVATFAGGLAGDAEPATNAVVKLDDYDMAIINYNNIADGYAYEPESYLPETTTNSTEHPADWSNYGVYNMTFIHKGGEKLDVDNSVLSVTFNHATYSMPLKDIALDSDGELTAGEKLKLSVLPEGDPEKLADIHSGVIFGIAHQNMKDFPGMPVPDTFDWAIIDGSGNVISKGTADCRK